MFVLERAFMSMTIRECLEKALAGESIEKPVFLRLVVTYLFAKSISETVNDSKDATCHAIFSP